MRGLVQRIPARILRRIPARHCWALLMVLLVFSAPAGLCHGCADSSGLSHLWPQHLPCGGSVSHPGFLSLRVFLCELVARWDMGRGLLGPVSGSSSFSALYWQAITSHRVNLHHTTSHLVSQLSLQHPQSCGLSLSLWPMKVAKRICSLNVHRSFGRASLIE